jgi:hypothetical protein
LRTGEEGAGSFAVCRVFRNGGDQLFLLENGPIYLACEKEQEKKDIGRWKPEDEDAGGGKDFADRERMPHIRVESAKYGHRAFTMMLKERRSETIPRNVMKFPARTRDMDKKFQRNGPLL